jgi:2'-5' RNA ligase
VAELALWQLAEIRRGRAVTPEKLHITLAFLGSRPAGDTGAVVEALESVTAGAGRIVLRARAYRETRSVGMLLLDDEDDRARTLAERLHAQLESLGLYRREARQWHPHLTVVRFRDRPRLAPPPPDLGAVVPSDAAVFISRLRSGGAQYDVVKAVRLGG